MASSELMVAQIELLSRAEEFTEIGLKVEDVYKALPIISDKVKSHYSRDEAYHREEGDEPYPRRVQAVLAKDYAIEALNKVFGEKRFELGSRTKDALLDFTVLFAAESIRENIFETLNIEF